MAMRRGWRFLEGNHEKVTDKRSEYINITLSHINTPSIMQQQRQVEWETVECT